MTLSRLRQEAQKEREEAQKKQNAQRQTANSAAGVPADADYTVGSRLQAEALRERLDRENRSGTIAIREAVRPPASTATASTNVTSRKALETQLAEAKARLKANSGYNFGTDAMYDSNAIEASRKRTQAQVEAYNDIKRIEKKLDDLDLAEKWGNKTYTEIADANGFMDEANSFRSSDMAASELRALERQKENLLKQQTILMNSRNAAADDPKLRQIREELNEIDRQALSLKKEKKTLEEYERQDLIDSGEYRDASLWDVTVNAVKQGYLNSIYGQESYNDMLGRENEKQKYEDILAGEEYRFIPGNGFEEAVSGAANLLGQQLRQWTDKRSVAGAMTGAGIALAAGQAGPQALIPEEIATVPGAFFAGMQAGSLMSNLEIEAGLAYNEMIDNGISPNVAQKIALMVGGGNAALETLQLDELVKGFRILKNSGATQSAAQRLLQLMIDKGLDIGNETLQEVLQEGVTIAGAQAANKLETGEWAYTSDEVLDRLGDTAKSSALSFGLMNVPSAGFNSYNIVQDQKKQDSAYGGAILEVYDGSVQDVIETGLTSDPSTKSYKQAAALQQKIEKGETVTDAEIGRLYQENIRTIEAEERKAASTDNAVMNTSTEDAQNQRGTVATTQRTETERGSSRTDVMFPYTQKNSAGNADMPNYGENGMRTFMEIAEASSEPVGNIRMNFESAYQAGLVDTPESALSFANVEQKMAYNAGQQDRLLTLSRNKQQGVTATFESGGLLQNELSNDLDTATRDTLHKLGKATGAKIIFDESLRGGQNNGYYKNGEIHISPDAEDPVMVVVKHELTHHLQTAAPEAYVAYRDYAVRKMNEGQPYGSVTVAEAKQNRYYELSKGEVDLTTEGAMDEVAAEFTEFILGDDEKLRSFVDEISGTAETRTWGQKIFDAIHAFIEKVKGALGVKNKTIGDEVAMKKYGVTMQQLEKAEKLWKDAVREAVKKTKNAAHADGGVNAAESVNKDNSGETVTNKDGEPVAQFHKNGYAQFSLKTYKADGRTNLKDWLDKRVAAKTISKADADDIVRQLDDFYDICQKFTDKYAPFGAWSNAEVVRDAKGKPVFSVVKKNGEYAMNLDFSLVCKKRRTLDAVFREMIDRGVLDAMELGEAQIAGINQIIRESGFETACALCFVDSKRYRQANVSDSFVNQYNDMVRMLIPEGSDIEASYFDFLGRGLTSKSRSLDKVSDKELGSGIVKLKKIMQENGKLTVAHKIAWHLLNNPQDRKLLMRSEFMNTDGFEALNIKNKKILGLYNSSKGSGGPKAALSDVQYLGDILKKSNFTPAKAYAVGGVRIQSFSDYIPRLVFDYLQMTADLTAKKLPAHAYTKEEIFAKQFGMTGIKINLSLVPAVVDGGVAPGLDANGDYVWYDGQSFGSDVNVKGSGQTGFETAVEIQNAAGYSANCGTIAVGISDEQIWKMLDDPDIRMIIPYHKSSLNHIVAVMNNIDQYKDYTGVQNTRDAKTGSKITGKDFGYNDALRRTGDAKAATAEYLAWCKENGYLPKFDTFASHENYYKLLEDFSTYDNGKAAPQGPVTMTFPKKGDAFGSMAKLIENGLEEDAVLEGRRQADVPGIVDKIEASFKKDSATKFSLKDQNKLMKENAQMDETVEINPVEISPINEITDINKYNYLVDSFKKEGWNGRPIVVVENGNNGYIALTGSHRIYAAGEAGIPVKAIVLEYSDEIDELISASYDEERASVANELHDDGILSDTAYQLIVREDDLNFENYDVPYSEQKRFSLKDQNDLLRENAKLKAVNQALREQFKTTKFAKVDSKALDSFAKKLLRDYQSGADIDDTRTALDDLYTYIANGENGDGATWEIAYRKAFDAAMNILQNVSVVNDDLYREYKELRDRLRTTGITLDRRYADSLVGYDRISEFRKKYFGRIKLVKDGLPVDVAYEELASDYPGLFDAYEHSHPADQLLHIAEVLDSLRPYEENPYSYNMRESASWLANDIMERFFELPQAKPTFADKAERKLTETKIKDQKKLDRLREQKNARIAEIIAENREKVKRVQEKERQKRAEAVAETKEHYAAKEARMSENRKASVLRKRITKHAADLSQKLLRPSDKQHIPEDLRGTVAALLESINLESQYTIDPVTGKRQKNGGGEPVKRTQLFQDLKKQYMRISQESSMVVDPALLGDEETQGWFEQVIALGETRVADMNLEELNILWNVMRSVEHSITTANKVLSKAKFQKTTEWANAIQEETATRRAMKGRKLEEIRMDLENPYTFFSHYGEAGHAIYRMLRNAQDHQQIMTTALQAEVEKIVDPKTVRNLEKETHEFTTERGEKLTLTTAHIMEIHELMKREQARDHLTKGGIVQPEIKSAKIKRGTDSVLLTLDDLSSIVGTLTDEQVQIADALQKLTSTMLAAYGNEASMKAYGYKKFTGTDYWPIQSAREGVHSNIEKGNTNTRSIKNIGLAKSVIPHANNPLDISGVFRTFSSHAADMIDYAAWLCPMEDANRLYNYEFRDIDGSRTGKTMKGLLDRVGGKGAQQYWFRLMEDIQNGIKPASDTWYGKAVDKVVGNVKSAAVGANIRVVIQQPTAIVRAAAVLSPADMAKGLVSGGGWKAAMEHSAIAQRKDMGGFDIGSPMQMSEILFDTRTGLRKFNDKLSAPAGAADAVTWGRIWNACEWAVKREQPSLKAGSEDFYAVVDEIFTEVIDQTQVVDGVLQRAQVMRSGNAVVKQATAFMGEPTMSLNMVLRAYDEWRGQTDKAKRSAALKKISKTIIVLVATNAVNALAQSLIDAERDDDDEKKYWERVWAAFTGLSGEEESAWEKATAAVLNGNLGSGLNLLTYMPGTKDIISIFSGYDVTRMDADVMADIIKSGKTFAESIGGSGKKTPAAALKEFAHNIARACGISATNIIRDAWGIYRSIAIETDNIGLLYEITKAEYNIGFESNSGQFINLLYRAYTSDKTAYEKIYADMVESGIDPEKIKNGMETRMKKDHGVKKVEDLADRYLPPEQKNRYDRSISSMDKSSVWRSATDAQRGEIEADLHDLITESDAGKALQEKIDEGAAWGVDESEYLLYKLALDMVDQPNKSGEYGGTPTNEEKAAAIAKLDGLRDSEIAYLWDTEDGYDAFASGIDMRSYVEYVGDGGGVSIEKIISAKEAGIEEDTYFDFLDMLNEYDQPTESGKYGSFTQAEAAAAVAAMPGLTNEERAYLWQSVNKSWKPDKNPWK